jgi:hypothetical protein
VGMGAAPAIKAVTSAQVRYSALAQAVMACKNRRLSRAGAGHWHTDTPSRRRLLFNLVMARWLLVKNRRPSGSWPVTIQDDADRSVFKRGADGEVHSWDELNALAAEHAIGHGKVGGPGLAEMSAALGPAPDE